MKFLGASLHTQSLRITGGSPAQGEILQASTASGDVEWSGAGSVRVPVYGLTSGQNASVVDVTGVNAIITAASYQRALDGNLYGMFDVPADYVSGLVLNLGLAWWTATTGQARLRAAFADMGDSFSLDPVFGNQTAAMDIPVPATARTLEVVGWNIESMSPAASDRYMVRITHLGTQDTVDDETLLVDAWITYNTY